MFTLYASARMYPCSPVIRYSWLIKGDFCYEVFGEFEFLSIALRTFQFPVNKTANYEIYSFVVYRSASRFPLIHPKKQTNSCLL